MDGDGREAAAFGWWIFVALATLGGLYWAAEAVKQEVWFWAFLGVAVVLGVGRFGARKFANWRVRYAAIKKEASKVPGLMRAAAESSLEASRLQTVNSTLESQIAQSREAGVRAGRRRVVGEIAANLSESTLKPVAKEAHDGSLRIAAEVQSGPVPPAGCIFYLRVRGTGTLIATLEVGDPAGDPVGTFVVLTVNDVIDKSKFEPALRDAQADQAIPPTWEIAARKYETVSELGSEWV